MNTAHKIHIPSVIESFVEALEDVDLSSSEKVVLCRLRLFIGYDKYKRISVKKIGEKCKFCESRTREILSSLVSKGRLIRIIQRGRTNLWAFPDQACRKTPTEVRPHLSPIKKEENVKNQNPKQTSFLYLPWNSQKNLSLKQIPMSQKKQINHPLIVYQRKTHTHARSQSFGRGH